MIANGVDFAVLEEGSGPLVLLLHGFPDTPHTWDPVRPALAAAGYRAVAPFLRGYHPSSPAPDGRYDVETLGRDALALIEACGVERAVVVGHDWGATAALAAAVLAPERVERLFLVAIPHPATVTISPGLLWKGRHFFGFKLPGAAARLRARDFALVDELVRRWSPAWDVPPDATRAVKDSLRHPGAAEAAVEYYRQLSPRLPPAFRRRVSVPTVAFAGATDGVLPPSIYPRGQRWFERYQVIELPGGHFLHREHPEEFTRHLLAFLAAS